jgi:hypothetical protein
MSNPEKTHQERDIFKSLPAAIQPRYTFKIFAGAHRHCEGASVLLELIWEPVPCNIPCFKKRTQTMTDHRPQPIDLFRQSPLFSGLTLDEMNQFIDFTSEKIFAKDELSIRQNTPGDAFYILADGELKVFRVGEYEETITLGAVLPCECIGEMGFFPTADVPPPSPPPGL